MENQDLDREITLQDKVDVAWDFLLDVNPRRVKKDLTEKDKKEIRSFIDLLKSQGKSKRAIKRAVLNKFKVSLT
jgi:hypothetical protein